MDGLSRPFFYPDIPWWQSEPQSARTLVWALSLSLAATKEIDVSFSSSPYLDVSVQEVPSAYLCIQYAVTEVCSAGFPHSEIHGSRDICSSPWLIAAYHVFRRLSVPRHPPCALISFVWVLRVFLISNSLRLLVVSPLNDTLGVKAFTGWIIITHTFFNSRWLYFNLKYQKIKSFFRIIF